MSRALFLAHKCSASGDVPVGAVVVDSSGRVVGEGWNRREADSDPTAHAEILALRDAGRTLGDWNLAGCTLIVTLEPCTMCAGAVVLSRVDTVVFGAWDEKAGACGSVRDVVRDSRLNHQVQVIGGVMEEEAAVQLRGFFAEKRMQAENRESAFWQRQPQPQPARSRPVVAVVEPVAPVAPPVVPVVSAPPRVEPPVAAAAPPVPPRTRRSDRHADRVVVPPLQLD